MATLFAWTPRITEKHPPEANPQPHTIRTINYSIPHLTPTPQFISTYIPSKPTPPPSLYKNLLPFPLFLHNSLNRDGLRRPAGVSGGVLRRREGDGHRRRQNQPCHGVQVLPANAKREDRDLAQSDFDIPRQSEEEPEVAVLRRPPSDSGHRKGQLRRDMSPEGVLLPRHTEEVAEVPGPQGEDDRRRRRRGFRLARGAGASDSAEEEPAAAAAIRPDCSAGRRRRRRREIAAAERRFVSGD